MSQVGYSGSVLLDTSRRSATTESTGTSCPDLTANNLIAIGVTAVGHAPQNSFPPSRHSAPLRGPQPRQRRRRRPGPAPAQAERRQLTVMFCDLVGSTALSTGMDPEDCAMSSHRFRTAAVDAIRRYEGFVAKYMGDGILFYFGYRAPMRTGRAVGAGGSRHRARRWRS